MKIWQKIKAMMENMMSATAFAEANDPDEAIRLSGIKPLKGIPSFEAITTAITFAEAGEGGMAREYMGLDAEPEKSRVLDIPGVKVWVGTVCLETAPLNIPGVKVWSGKVPVNSF